MTQDDDGSAPMLGSQPVAWAVVYPNGDDGVIAFRKEDAEDMASDGDAVVPLYRQPTLTDEEREAIEQAIDEVVGKAPAEAWAVSTLRSLLKRLA